MDLMQEVKNLHAIMRQNEDLINLLDKERTQLKADLERAVALLATVPNPASHMADVRDNKMFISEEDCARIWEFLKDTKERK